MKLNSIEKLVDNLLKGDRRSIARAITIAENRSTGAQKILQLIYPHTGKAHAIGLTGPPGSGKSTLIGKMVKELRDGGKTVGVVAIDPTSPFTGGAFLGDRIRMQELSTDQGVFIRSMATRNAPGGIARATKEAVGILDAAGKDVVIIETAGAGQSDAEIAQIAQTAVVVLAPGLGDEIQAIKAGMMEIGDIFVVNKGDRENADKAITDIKAMLELNTGQSWWKPPIVKTIALSGEGVSELLEKINQHKQFLETGALSLKLRRNLEKELVEAIKQKIADSVVEDLKKKGEIDELVQEILEKKIDPYSAADRLVRKSRKRSRVRG